MTYAFLTHLYGSDHIDYVMNLIEYAPHTNPHWDPFSVVHNVSISDSQATSYLLSIGPGSRQERISIRL
jgi:hypothetical protein